MNIYQALQTFAEAVTAKMTQLTSGEPEDQLRGPLESFMGDAGPALGFSVVCTGEAKLPGRLGKPDYAVHAHGLLAGFVELKAPGVGANPRRYSGHNRDQWKRFQLLPNVLYCDGNEWALYHKGEVAHKLVRLSGDVRVKGRKAVSTEDARALERLLREFLSWEPSIPIMRNGKIDLKGFAQLLAPLCRMLRDDVTDALRNADSSMRAVARDWGQSLFADASDEQFADAYAQTVTFALLLARSEGAEPLSPDTASQTLDSHHALLGRALAVLTDFQVRSEMSASLDVLLRVIGVVPRVTLTGPEDPWLYFYEDFLAAYDAKLRKDVGVYYTPVEVVRAQVRLIDDLLVNRLGKRLGFCDPGVVTLDPAAGTGTYLLGAIEHALAKVKKQQGAGAVPGQASTLAANLFGFEFMVGPYAVTELRVSRALTDRDAVLPAGGPHIYLTDTLESPNAVPPQLPLFFKPIADQHAKALQVKSKVPVIVCLGNPPYDRHEAAAEDNKPRSGGWVRWGDHGESPILDSFLEPAMKAGHGVHIKNIYNLYVYFWRWALWKVFESTTPGPGVVSFISASSYLDGDAFCGMREHMRRVCDEIWILYLRGEGRGTRETDNIFAIQTPVAIAVAARAGKGEEGRPAAVHYARIKGSRAEKLRHLDAIRDFASVKWEHCPDDWQAPFRPAGKGDYFRWPLLTDIMPWQHSGIQLKRTWPIAPDLVTLNRRWRQLLHGEDRAQAFHGTGDREIDGSYRTSINNHLDPIPVAQLPISAPMPPAAPYAYRFLDRQKIIADARLVSRPRPVIWQVHSSRQMYLTNIFSQPLGEGPGLAASAIIPDLDFFRGSYGAKAAIPLFRDAEGTESNILPGLLELLGKSYKRQVSPEDFLAYVYGALAQPAFTGRYWEELETRELRVPIAKDATLFEKVRETGARLLWLHTYGERFIPPGRRRGQIPAAAAKCVKAVPCEKEGYPESFEYNDLTQTLHVGAGEFRPVLPDVFEFEVSGLKVVQSWLKYRMKKGAGRKSSPLDDIRPERWTSQFTTELLELLWVLEATVAGYPEQEKLLQAVVSVPCFRADELPSVLKEMRKPPAAPRPKGSGTLEGIV
ncbi:MAG: N-6 DNA methylase [Candidatus Coatesbacteria bacterium]|nr:N-6 DNA methylase [Candidatus Coatesbacteria bacterium]